MVSPVGAYQEEMHRNVGYFATWLPSDPIALGDLGILRDGRFSRLSSLQALQIPFAEEVGEAEQEIQCTSKSGTKISSSLGTKVAGLAKASITIELVADGAFVFQASGVRTRRLANPGQVSREIVNCYKRGDWDKRWLLVETCHTARFATVIISQDKSASVALEASLDGPLPTTFLADPKLGLRISSTNGRVVHVVGQRGLTPLYSCLRVQPHVFGEPSLEPARGIGDRPTELERVGIRELLNS
jgi:hypothetical protein